MKLRKATVLLALAASSLLVSAGISPASAQVLPVKFLEESSLSISSSPSPESEFPETMTDAEMAAWSAGVGTADARRSATARAAAGDRCYLVPGQMWKRSSADKLPYGGVGSKPKLERCTAGVVETKLTSQVYMHNGWDWVKKGKPAISFGRGNMEQKTVLYACANVNSNAFKVVTVGWGRNAAGVEHSGTDTTGEYRLGCG